MEGRCVFAGRLKSERMKLERGYALVQTDEEREVNMDGSILEEVGPKLDAALSLCPDGVYLERSGRGRSIISNAHPSTLLEEEAETKTSGGVLNVEC